MRKMTVLGASALLLAGLMGSPAAAFAAPIAGAPVAATPSGGESTCLPKEDKVDVDGNLTEITVTAEPGYLITGYCVKAGSDKQGDGPEYVTVAPTETVTIKHSSGKDISHYSLITIKVGSTPSPSPSVPGSTPSPSVPGATPSPSEPGATPSPSEPGVEPSDGSVPPVDETGGTPSPSAEEPGELAATGASTAIGFTLIALALVGGGVTLIVLRRKGVLGS